MENLGRIGTYTGDMIFDVQTLILFVSHGTTLEARSIIMTGTPESASPLAPR